MSTEARGLGERDAAVLRYLSEHMPRDASNGQDWLGAVARAMEANPETRHARSGAEDIAARVERSSLGTPEAQALRATVSDERAARVMARAKELEAEDAAPTKARGLGERQIEARALREAADDAEAGQGEVIAYLSGDTRRHFVVPWLRARADALLAETAAPETEGHVDVPATWKDGEQWTRTSQQRSEQTSSGDETSTPRSRQESPQGSVSNAPAGTTSTMSASGGRASSTPSPSTAQGLARSAPASGATDDVASAAQSADAGAGDEGLAISVAIKAQNPNLETAWRQIAWWEQTCNYWRDEALKGYRLRDSLAERDKLTAKEALTTAAERLTDMGVSARAAELLGEWAAGDE